ncbi:unnamed protein product, partial [Prorocentrum cordatum]
ARTSEFLCFCQWSFPLSPVLSLPQGPVDDPLHRRHPSWEPSAHGAAQEGPRLPGRVAPGHPLAADQPRHDLEDGPLLQEHDLAARDGQDLGRARGGGEGGALQGGVLPEAQLRAAAPAHRHDGEGLDAQRAPDPRPLALLGRRVMGGQRG